MVQAERSNFPAALEQYNLAAKQFSNLLAATPAAASTDQAVQSPESPDSQPESELRKRHEAWGDAAIKYLNRAGEAGFFDTQDMRDHAKSD